LLETILRAGDPQCVSDIKSNSFKIKMLESFTFKEEGTEKGTGICDKAENINRLLNDPELLADEREKSRKIRGRVFGENVHNEEPDSPGKSYMPEQAGYNPESPKNEYENPKQEYESPKEHFKKHKEKTNAKKSDWREESDKKLSKHEKNSDNEEPEDEEKPKKAKKSPQKIESPPKGAEAALVTQKFDLLQIADDSPKASQNEQKTQDLLQIFGNTPTKPSISAPKPNIPVEDFLFINPSPPQTKPSISNF